MIRDELEEGECEDEENKPEPKHIARQYQTELFDHALKDNSILVLGTGSGKTFISILLIKALNESNSSTDCKIDNPDQSVCYHPWNEQIIPDKCIADCCEALIGTYLLCGGELAAKQFMIWLGYDYLKKDYNLPESALLNKDVYDLEKKVKKFSKTVRIHELEKILNYTFNDKTFLIEAISHPSDIQNKLTNYYQRLEFLGDAVLDYMITGHIFSTNLQLNPGELTDKRSFLVNNETLSKAAVKLNLHKYILHASMQLSQAIGKFISLLESDMDTFSLNTEDDCYEIEDIEVPKALGDIVEAIIGAVYIDSNENLEITWNVIKLLLKDALAEAEDKVPINRVREVFEMFPDAAKFEYMKTEEKDPSKCILTIKNSVSVTGIGKNRRVAKQAAAKLLLQKLKINKDKEEA